MTEETGLDKAVNNRAWANMGYQLLLMSFVLVLLQLTAYLGVIGSHVVVTSLLVGLWLMLASVLFWRGRSRRKLWLTSHVQDDSRFKKKLGGGVVMYSASLAIAAPLALALFLALSQGLGLVPRLGLIASVVLWIVLEYSIGRKVESHVKGYAVRYFSKSATLWLIVFLLVPSLLIAKFWEAVPDLSPLGGFDAFRYGQAQAMGHAEWLHTIAGFWTGLDYLCIWAAERITANDSPTLMKLGIWGVVLLKTLAFVGSALLLLEGASVLATRNNGQTSKNETASQRSWLPNGVAAIVAIALMTGFVWDEVAANPWGWLTGKTLMVSIAGHAYQLSPGDLENVLSANEKQIGNKRDQYIHELSGDVDARIDSVFDAAITRVPDYADWSFSLRGKMSVATAYVLSHEGNKLQATLFPDGGLESRINTISQYYSERLTDDGAALGSAWVKNVKERLKPYRAHPFYDQPHADKQLDLEGVYAQALSAGLSNGKRAVIEGGVALGVGGLGTSIVDRSIRKIRGAGGSATKSKSGTTLLARTKNAWKNVVRTRGRAIPEMLRSGGSRMSVAARGMFKKLGFKSAARGAVKAAPKIASRAAVSYGAGTLCGPAALVCGTATFAAVTLGTWIVELKYDEYQNKDHMEAKLVTRLNNSRENLKRHYYAKLNATFGPDIEELNLRVKDQVLPFQYLAHQQPVAPRHKTGTKLASEPDT